MPTVKEIVRRWIVDNGYDGLHAEDQCGCRLDDLMPCDDVCYQCAAGYLLPGDNEAPWYIGEPEPIAIGLHPCPACKSNNIKCRGAIWNCEDCGERWTGNMETEPCPHYYNSTGGVCCEMVDQCAHPMRSKWRISK